MNVPPPYSEPSNGSYYIDDYPPDYKYSFDIPEKPVPSPEYSQSFPISSPKYNDKFFTYVFLTTIILFISLTYISYNNSIDNSSFHLLNSSKSINALYTLIFVSIITPLLCSSVLLFVVYLFPTFFIYLAFLLVPLSLFSISITSLMTGAILPSFLFGILGFFSLLFMFQNFNRFSFSALMIKLVVNAMSKYPSTILISLLSSLITIIISILYMLSLSIIVNSRLINDDSNCPHPNGNDICISNLTILIYIFVIFSGCYILQVIQNTTYVILSGIFSSWYFFDTFDSNLKPKNPSFGSIKRTFTICFGSICFGSLLVSIVQTIRISLQILKSKLQSQRLRNNNNDDSNGGTDGLLFCMLICIVSILEWFASEFEYWMQWFNRYAYSYLSMYGKSYLKSAKDTFEILKYKGIDILINDSLISSAIFLYSILSILINSLILIIVFKSTNILKEMGPEMLVIGGLSSLIICYFIVNSIINVLDVGYVTFMIGLAIDPDAFTRTNASSVTDSSIQRLQIWEKMNVYYPGIREKVMVDWPEEETN
jgi:hypothetical protein